MARFADYGADRLVVFVHGFGGNATRTWKGMDALLEEPAMAASDVVFYGYGSMAAPARNSATLLHQLLSAAGSASSAWLSALRRAHAIGPREYRDILIVAHSLGAVVTRRVLLDAIDDSERWVRRTRLLLFGPAHMGTRLVDLSRMLRSGLGSLIADIFAFGRVKVPVLDDLEPGSPFLTELLVETEAALSRGFEGPVRAQKVIFGERDNVVVTTPFGRDPRSIVWAGEDHCSVCRAPQAVFEVAEVL